MQLTNPPPDSMQEIFDWKKNIAQGLTTIEEKYNIAKSDLVKFSNNFTVDQLQMQSWQRFNGGRYYTYDSERAVFLRNDSFCSKQSGGICYADKVKFISDHPPF